MKEKGWIALDIDGTITLDKYSVPQPVIDFLRELHHSGWRIALATGRAFCFASAALKKFDFPFILLPQNGSVALEMPERKLIFKRYLSPSVIPVVEKAFEGFDADFLVYAGYDLNDRCYWRPSRISKDGLEYVEILKQREKEAWVAVEEFELKEDFPLIKCFGHPDRMEIVQDRLLASDLFHISKIRDLFHGTFELLLVTEKKASKGLSLKELFRLKGRGEKVIAAGDDENDISLLEAADVKIAMSHAPEKLQEVAQFIAPPTRDLGIITALQMVLKNDR